MRIRAACAALLAILPTLLPSLAHADGKFYAGEAVPPGVPYQRALLLFEAGKETLVLQSKFGAPGGSLGWVVPVPAVPELGTLPAEVSGQLFFALDVSAQPETISVSSLLIAALSLGGLAAGIFLFRRRRLLWGGLCVAGTVLLAMGGLTLNLTRSSIAVLHEESVGIYDVKVITGDDGAHLVAWLAENGLQFTRADEPILDGYRRKGWCFVVARVRERAARRDPQELVDPLILRFAAPAPIYPLALTGTTSTPTEVLLYTLSPSKLDARGVLPLRFAGRTEAGSSPLALASGATWQPLAWERSLRYLCKFKGTLRPEQMQSDLVLAAAADNDPYREWILAR
jgi:hypothetical protein